MRKWTLKLVLLAAFALAFINGSDAAAQPGWPNRPISLIVPFPPGGPSDNAGRLVGEGIAADLKATLVTINKPGALTQVGTAFVAQSKPDGYTVLFSPTNGFTVMPHLRASLPYDPKNDFEPIGGLGEYLAILAVRKDLGVATMAELIQMAKANPGKLTWGSAGVASVGHIYGELLKRDVGINIVHIPFKGSADAATALLGGQVDAIIDSTAVPLAKGGRVTALAVFGATHHPELKDVPTLKESGLNVWLPTAPAFGVYVPKGTPAAITTRLSQAMEKTLTDPSLRERLQRVSVIPTWQAPTDFRKSLDDDFRSYGELLRALGIRPE